MNTIRIQLEYKWVPFKVNSRHLIFHEYENDDIKIEKGKCSHWGAVIYKWEGKIIKGINKGKIGILIGETDDIRARLNQYKSGQQKRGNKYWREAFLRKGRISLWVLDIKKCVVNDKTINFNQKIKRKNFRLVLEQLLVIDLLDKCDQSKTWIVNKI